MQLAAASGIASALSLPDEEEAAKAHALVDALSRARALPPACAPQLNQPMADAEAALAGLEVRAARWYSLGSAAMVVLLLACLAPTQEGCSAAWDAAESARDEGAMEAALARARALPDHVYRVSGSRCV